MSASDLHMHIPYTQAPTHVQAHIHTCRHTTWVSHAKKKIKQKGLFVDFVEALEVFGFTQMQERIQKSTLHLSSSCLFPWVCEQPMVGVYVWFHHAQQKALGPAWECCSACHWHTFLLGCDPCSDRVEQRDIKELPDWLWELSRLFYHEYLPIKAAEWRQRLRFYSVYFFNYVCTCVSLCASVSVWSMCTWVQLPVEARRGTRIPWSWSYRQLRAIVLNHGVNSPSPGDLTLWKSIVGHKEGLAFISLPNSLRLSPCDSDLKYTKSHHL